MEHAIPADGAGPCCAPTGTPQAPEGRSETTTSCCSPTGTQSQGGASSSSATAAAAACCGESAGQAEKRHASGVAGFLQSGGTALARSDKVVLAILLFLGGLVLYDPKEAWNSLGFTGAALWHIAPFLVASILLAAWITAAGADRLAARAFTGRPLTAVGLAAVIGALSPFCSCGVVPLIAGLLAAGVPLAPVMAFWLASPIMDPEMFILTAAELGILFALAKTLAAISLGIIGGLVVLLLTEILGEPLAREVRVTCGARRLLESRPVHWTVWDDSGRRSDFLRTARRTGWFLLRWMALAYLVESLLVRWIPAPVVADWLGAQGGFWAVPLAALVGVPAYMNGFAAIPLVSGLIDLGMTPGAALAFMVAGGVTSLPAALAVWALVRIRVFLLYLGLSLTGALLSGWVFQMLLG